MNLNNSYLTINHNLQFIYILLFTRSQLQFIIALVNIKNNVSRETWKGEKSTEKFITRNLAITEVAYKDAIFVNGEMTLSELRHESIIGTRHSNDKLKKILIAKGVANEPVLQEVKKTTCKYSMPLNDFIEQAHAEIIEQ